MWLRWLRVVLQTERLPVLFPVRARAWVVNWSLGWGTCEKKPIGVSLSFSLPPLSVKIKLKKKKKRIVLKKRKQSLEGPTSGMGNSNQRPLQQAQKALRQTRHIYFSMSSCGVPSRTFREQLPKLWESLCAAEEAPAQPHTSKPRIRDHAYFSSCTPWTNSEQQWLLSLTNTDPAGHRTW